MQKERESGRETKRLLFNFCRNKKKPNMNPSTKLWISQKRQVLSDLLSFLFHFQFYLNISLFHNFFSLFFSQCVGNSSTWTLNWKWMSWKFQANENIFYINYFDRRLSISLYIEREERSSGGRVCIILYSLHARLSLRMNTSIEPSQTGDLSFTQLVVYAHMLLLLLLLLNFILLHCCMKGKKATNEAHRTCMKRKEDIHVENIHFCFTLVCIVSYVFIFCRSRKNQAFMHIHIDKYV